MVAAPDAAQASYEIDWRVQARRPFKRGFISYGTGGASGEDPAKRRRALGVKFVEDPMGEDLAPVPLASFEEIGVLPPWLLEALRDGGHYEPTALQAQALPIILAGQNFVGVGRAARDNAAAFLIPAAVHLADQATLRKAEPGPVVLVLVPTQEMAEQVTSTAVELFKHSGRCAQHAPGGMRVVNVSGGGLRSDKLKELGPCGAHLVVGTPKRVHDMAAKEQLPLLRVTLLVLHCVDAMLEKGQRAELQELASWVRPERHTVALASTWPRDLVDLVKSLCAASGLPVRISVSGGSATGPLVAKGAVAKAADGAEAQEYPEGWGNG